MKIRTPKFNYDAKNNEYTAMIYSSDLAGWVEVIIFKDPFGWNVNYENKDPSERIHQALDSSSAKAWVEEFHCNSVRKDFQEAK